MTQTAPTRQSARIAFTSTRRAPAGRIACVALGGAVGAGARWAVTTAWPSGEGFPWTTLAVNVAGSFLLGVLLAVGARRSDGWLVGELGGVGFCGGFTTFSTYAVEVARLVGRDRAAVAVTYATVSAVAAIAAVVLGAAVVHRARDAGLPVEAAP